MNANEPAFAAAAANNEGNMCQPGLTKREYFALHGAASYMAGRGGKWDRLIERDAANFGTNFADALLAELAKETK